MASTATTERTDLYPSRVDDKARLLRRQDPVVHGDASDGPLSPEQVAQFERDGALLLEDVFSSDEVQRFSDRLAELSADPAVRADDRTITEPESDDVRSIFEVHKTDPLFQKVAADARVADAARQLLDTDVYIHQSRINFKPGFAGKEFWWHSDFETWHVEDGMPRMRCLSASIALTDNYPYNGPLLVIAGSHKTYVTTVGETPADHYKASLKRQEIGVPDHDSLETLFEQGEVRQMTGKAGSVVLFDCNIMHGSAGNITPFPRSNVFLVYNSVENAVQEPFGAPSRRPTYIAAREVDPLPRG